MRIRYIPETDTLLIRLKDEPVAESEYLEGRGIVVDYNEKDEVVGYEIMGWSKLQKSSQELVLETQTQD
ncbi:DUF2283 domain-containing protein [Hydrogenivirga sp. 128-5-R1-1]|uniref:DUF2283 domain-containing protein n=1 Tax=Hydrogenivirga sp. 128-5-R1-1 TaxID=392423 RepID=UPI00015F18F5|nr:DUF2283 domain-containing protein [Hydrogenivirga sp. 128-5-R1-1]EDP75540.1 hypothetical protein HG1285_16286 [Hydrogenivirga sp. 128-5-R1-1]